MTGIPGPQAIESIVAFWICIPLAVICALLMIGCIIVATDRSVVRRRGAIVWAITFGLVGAAFVGGYAWGMYPDDFAHHHYIRYSGTIATFGVLDTRAAAARPGQVLTIDCVQQWQYAGSEGQDCEFVSVAGTGAR